MSKYLIRYKKILNSREHSEDMNMLSIDSFRNIVNIILNIILNVILDIILNIILNIILDIILDIILNIILNIIWI